MLLKLKNLKKSLYLINSAIEELPEFFTYGKLISSIGIVLEATGLRIPIGSICIISNKTKNKIIQAEAEVIAFKKNKTFLMLFKETVGLIPGSTVHLKHFSNTPKKNLPLGHQLLGRILDGLANPLDGKQKISIQNSKKLNNIYINPVKRTIINKTLDVGVRSINALYTIGKGQKMGIFSSSGLGKSILMEMIAKNTTADVIVIALIGERGREIKEFIYNTLGSKHLSKSVIIASPSDTSPILRIQSAIYATNIAEYFRNKNKHVLLLMDSLTRYAMAYREIALSVGELPTSQGYPSSIYSKISTLLEKTGNNTNTIGSITSFYTVLTEVEESFDSISDLIKSILDGHIILSKKYAELGYYPAIDIEKSISRVMPNLIKKEHLSLALKLKKMIASYFKNKDLINIGAYVQGSDKILDQSIKIWEKIENFLIQDKGEKCNYQKSFQDLKNLLK